MVILTVEEYLVFGRSDEYVVPIVIEKTAVACTAASESSTIPGRTPDSSVGMFCTFCQFPAHAFPERLLDCAVGVNVRFRLAPEVVEAVADVIAVPELFFREILML